ncbi:MAG: agmatinase [Chloroflexi bacterium]|nr:agmatinase [Chloroflexota bacterium]
MDNSVYGSTLQPFAGITTFMRQPATRELKDVDVAILGIPFDSATSYRSGTRFGPRKIRELSAMLWGSNQVLRVAPLDHLRVIDYGDVDVVPVDIHETFARTTATVKTILDAGATVISLGGDHSLALPLLRAHHAKFGKLAVVHFDSHGDMWDYDFVGYKYSHGTPFRRAVEEDLIDTDAYLQIGIRGSTSALDDYEMATNLGARIMTIRDAMAQGTEKIVETIRQTVGTRPIYISFDIDAVDPAYAPGTGTPEVGGFTSFQALEMVRGLAGLNSVGFDLVEVDPSFDHGDITSLLAANLVFEFLSLAALKKRAAQ